jgi:uncharacterized protein (DUF305 family)
MTSVTKTGDEAPFLAENNASISRMMTAMDIKPSGDADADFVALMVPLDRAAIDIAQAQLRHGRNEELKRIAQEIIVSQQEEIAAIRLALVQAPQPSEPSRIQP